jgi:hypothetical protein
MARQRRPLSQGPGLLIQLEPGSLELLDDPLGELVAGIVKGMFLKEPAKQVAAPGQGEADREHELGAARVMIHARRVLACSHAWCPDPQLAVKAAVPGAPSPHLRAGISST